MTSTISGSQLIINGANATLDASAPSTLDFFGNAGGDVSVSGINTLTFSGALNRGTPLGGYVMSFRGERSAATSSPSVYSFGNGNARVVGPLMPQGGSVLSLVLNTDTSSTASVSVIGSVSGTLITVNLAASTDDSANGGGTFVANEQLYAQVTSGTVNGTSRVYWKIRFD